MNKKGFTLIEVIVTISIIGLLMGIMVPVVQNTSNRVKYKNYKNLQNLIIQATIDYLNNSVEDEYSIDRIKPADETCESIDNCSKRFTVGEILDKNIYYSDVKVEVDGEEKLTIINPTNGKSMRNRTFWIYYDTETYSLKGYFSKGVDDEKIEGDLKQ